VAEDKRDLSVLEAITPPAKEETVTLVEPQPVPKTVAEVKVQEVIIEAPQVTAALSSEKSKQIAAARGSDSESGDFKIVEEDKAKPAQICPPAQIAASSPRLVKAETGQFDINKSLQPGKASNGSKADIATVTDPDELEDDIDFLDLVKQAQYASISLLANHVTSTAIEQKCSDILVQGISDNVVVQYLKKGRVVSESRLVKQILPDLVACYKEMAGLDKTLTNKPQDRKVKLNVRETDIELRVTTVPEDDGEIVAISIKYL
jgi:type II secretory ATPase GspE/PulE/Tfp pilus assembly ATPase PilB-like protein